MLATTIVASVNRQSLRVTILGINYSPEPTGNAPYTTSLAEALVAAGHEVKVITGIPHYPEWKVRAGYSAWTRYETQNGVSITRLKHFVPKHPSATQRMHMELSFGARLVFARWGNPDVVLVLSPALFSSGMAVVRTRFGIRKPPIAVWVQDIYSRGITETGTGSGSSARIVAAVESWILRSADGVVAIHERFRDYMVGSLGLPFGNVSVIRNWTHLTSSPVADRASVRRRFGWMDNDVVLLHAGNMGKKQGLENVVETARLAQARGSHVRIVLLGDGNQRGRLESMSADLDRIQFIDPLPGEEFQSALAAADVLLVNELPGVKDMAVPSKLTSYFNSGLPIIAATDEGSVTAAEIATSGGGLRVDAADPLALLMAVECLGNDPQKAQELGQRGLKFRYETLSASAAINQYDEFVSSLASPRGR